MDFTDLVRGELGSGGPACLRARRGLTGAETARPRRGASPGGLPWSHKGSPAVVLAEPCASRCGRQGGFAFLPLLDLPPGKWRGVRDAGGRGGRMLRAGQRAGRLAHPPLVGARRAAVLRRLREQLVFLMCPASRARRRRAGWFSWPHRSRARSACPFQRSRILDSIRGWRAPARGRVGSEAIRCGGGWVSVLPAAAARRSAPRLCPRGKGGSGKCGVPGQRLGTGL